MTVTLNSTVLIAVMSIAYTIVGLVFCAGLVAVSMDESTWWWRLLALLAIPLWPLYAVVWAVGSVIMFVVGG